jgi:hypothetical protein
MSTNAKLDSVAVTEMSLINETHRVSTRLLVGAARRPAVPSKALAQLREFVVVGLRHLHDLETALLWPRIVTATPGAGYVRAELGPIYERLDVALKHLAGIQLMEQDDARHTLYEAAVVVRDGLHEYLRHQEPILFPALRDLITPAEWEEYIHRFVTSAPPIGRYVMGLPR